MRRLLSAPLLLLALQGCSPVYVAESAAGHGKLLWRRRSIARALADPRTPAALKEKLEVASRVRDFAFSRLSLRRSRDYSSYSHLDRAYVTYAVTGCRRTRFEPYEWWFPFLGRVPYKGYFKERDAEKEKSRLERLGWDAEVGGVTAYNTPLWFADPIPEPALGLPPGRLAGLLIHELAHGTVYYKDQTAFDESMATFVGDQGAEDFLREGYGEASKELADFRAFRARSGKFDAAIAEIYAELDALYAGGGSEEAKLKEREAVFASGRERLRSAGFELPVLNNAVILAHRVYHSDLDLFRKLHEGLGRDWPRTIEALRSLDKKDPSGALRKRALELSAN